MDPRVKRRDVAVCRSGRVEARVSQRRLGVGRGAEPGPNAHRVSVRWPHRASPARGPTLCCAVVPRGPRRRRSFRQGPPPRDRAPPGRAQFKCLRLPGPDAGSRGPPGDEGIFCFCPRRLPHLPFFNFSLTPADSLRPPLYPRSRWSPDTGIDGKPKPPERPALSSDGTSESLPGGPFENQLTGVYKALGWGGGVGGRGWEASLRLLV